MCRRLELGHWNQVSFLAIADFASGSVGERRVANDPEGDIRLGAIIENLKIRNVELLQHQRAVFLPAATCRCHSSAQCR
jgi:hypothetical protein